MTTGEIDAPARTEAGPCPLCEVENPKSARFCKACGSRLTPPAQCRECDKPLPSDARFCPSCGTAALAKRDLRSDPKPDPITEDRSETSQADESVSSEIAPEQALGQLQSLKKKKSTSVGIGANVLFLFAVVFTFVVIMVKVTKDAPKEMSPFQGGPPPSSSGGASGGKVSGSVALKDGVAPPAGGTLFVILRNAGMPAVGPPLAVKKIPDPSFPVKFTLSQDDMMMKGMPFTGPFDLHVRLDGDGNAMTKDPADLVPSNPPQGVALNTSDVSVLLDRRMDQPPAEAPAGAEAGAEASAGAEATAGAEASAGAEATAGAAVGGGSIVGVIKLKPELEGQAPTSGTLFLMLRNAGMPVGPPVAAKKFDSPKFPLEFSIGPEDVMMQGSPFSGPFDVQARLDTDGNAMTKAPGDVVVSNPASSVRPGDPKVEMWLDKRL